MPATDTKSTATSPLPPATAAQDNAQPESGRRWVREFRRFLEEIKGRGVPAAIATVEARFCHVNFIP